MCGIAGLINIAEKSIPTSAYSVVSDMINLLAHRGPDGRGILHNRWATLGHCRLSIIDIDSALQPMKSSDESLAITFNGEIFNYQELRNQCEQNYSFHSQGDTESILAQFLEHGERSFAKLRGQFAFCLHEPATGVTYLVRDPMGEKPLYFVETSETVIFASEVKAILCGMRSLGIEPQISPQAFGDYLSLNYVPGNETLVEGVRAVTPGHFVKFSPGKLGRLTSFLSSEEPGGPSSGSGYRHAAIELLSLAARRRTVSDVSIACLLSGGLDSSLALAFTAREGRRCTAYTADFEDTRFSEVRAAEKFAERLGVEHHRVLINPQEQDAEKLLRTLAWHGDTPLADSSACAVYLLAEQVGKSHKVALSGDGADELFGGYLTYRATRLSRGVPRWMRKPLSDALKVATSGKSRFNPGKVGRAEMLERFARALPLAPGAAHMAWNGCFLAEDKMRIVNPYMIQHGIFFDTFNRLADCFFQDPQRPAEQELLRFDQRYYLQGDILQKADRMGMAHGLEIRPFYLEDEVVRYARTLPSALSRDKAILREVMSVICPWYKSPKKQGFSIPVHSWLRTTLRAYAEETLFSRNSSVWDYLSYSEVRKVWDAHQGGRENYGFELWGILLFSIWFATVFSAVSVKQSLPILNAG